MNARTAAVLLLVVLVVTGAVNVAAADDTPAPADPELVDGLTAAEWKAEFVRMRRLAYKRRLRILGLEATFRHRDSVSEALNLACAVYGHCATLWRKARCESHLYRYAQNRSSRASGLLQFLPSTWRSTPFRGFSIFSPYANALAGGWMHTVGRGGEWVCR